MEYGPRIGKLGKLRPSCAAIIFDSARQKVLLTRRTDNGQWCLPGGAIDSGESAAEACAREVLEETGLVVHVGRLIGLYSTPDWLIEYADGNRFQAVVLSFEVEPIAGELTITNETTGFGYYSLAEMNNLDVMEQSFPRIIDALAAQEAAFVR